MRRSLPVLALIAGLLVACSGSASTAPQTASPAAAAVASTAPQTAPPTSTAPQTAFPISTPAPTASPTPTYLTVQQAAKAYLAVANTYNKAIKSAYAKYAKLTSLSAGKKYWALLAKAAAAFIKGVKAIRFPAEIQGEATALVKACVVFQRDAFAASKATSLAMLMDNVAAADKADRTATDKAAILRDDLGLPPNV